MPQYGPYTHREKAGPGRWTIWELNGPWLFEGEESFPELGGVKQETKIGDFTGFGRGLVIDGVTQLAEADDLTFTSALVYPAAITALSPLRWLVAGGGDGAAVREILRFSWTEEVTLVDISPLVIAKTRELIPSFWGGCEDNPRLKVVTRDVFGVLGEMASRGERVDVIVCDLTDPADGSYTPYTRAASAGLYTQDAMRLFADCLTEDGVFVAQAQQLSLLGYAGHRRLRSLLKKLYPRIFSYRAFVEFFGWWQGFIIAYKNPEWHFRRWSLPWADETFAPVEVMLAGLHRDLKTALDHYSTAVHEQLFTLPPILADRLDDTG